MKKIKQAVKDSDKDHPDLTFINIPSLFMGVRLGNDIEKHTGVAFNPGTANFQSINNKLYFPRQFAPLNTNSEDIFENEIKRVLGNNVQFVDCWKMYHAFKGEVHCGSVVKPAPVNDWWLKQPKKGGQQ